MRDSNTKVGGATVLRSGSSHSANGVLSAFRARQAVVLVYGIEGESNRRPVVGPNGSVVSELYLNYAGAGARQSSEKACWRERFDGSPIQYRYPLISKMHSTSTAALPGSDPMPTALRAPTPFSSPNTSASNSEKPLMTTGCSL